MHISLTPELKDFVKQKVDSGLYGNASEVIRDALRQMNRYEEFFYDLKKKHLIELLYVGERSGVSEFSVSDIIERESKCVNKDNPHSPTKNGY
ncbi:MAG: type II toxin-antitoxin system ParD family antitoxin [Balneolaceae bacterium]|nr:MAG: type II toxin-antitoxin system ParD family antitoxin [Balneolaceae bacterium]